MGKLPYRVLTLVMVMIAMSSWPSGFARTQVPSSPVTGDSPGTHVIAISPNLSVIEATTGAVRWRVGTSDDLFAAVGGADGVVYVSVAIDGERTNVFVVSLGSGNAEVIGQVSGRAMVKSLSPDGSQLHVLTYVADFTATGPPAAAIHLNIPERWRSPPMRTGARDAGGGVLADDGQWWYGLDKTRRLMAAD